MYIVILFSDLCHCNHEKINSIDIIYAFKSLDWKWHLLHMHKIIKDSSVSESFFFFFFENMFKSAIQKMSLKSMPLSTAFGKVCLSNRTCLLATIRLIHKQHNGKVQFSYSTFRINIFIVYLCLTQCPRFRSHDGPANKLSKVNMWKKTQTVALC